MDELLSEFFSETIESLEVVDVELVKFEQDPTNIAGLDKVFRLLHTVKGSAGFLGLDRLGKLAHATENLIDCFRDGAEVTDSLVSLTLEAIDKFKWILEKLGDSGEEPEGDDQEIIDQLNAISDGLREKLDAGKPGTVSLNPEDDEEIQKLIKELQGQETSSSQTQVNLVDEVPAENTVKTEASAEPIKQEEEKAETSAKKAPETKADKAEAASTESKGLKSTSIRVNMDTIEHLMTMVSELVLTRNQLIEIVRQQDDNHFKAPLQRLSNITSELQEGIMQTRMQPIGHAWQQIPRLIRSLNQQLNKNIQIEMIGAETELDRQVLELIRDPLTHMIRNSADHGVEDSETRIAAGKTPDGKITLSAHHEGGHIILSIADDGRGIPVEKVADKVVRSGLATEAELAQMSDSQVLRYIFEPGFTTTSEVSSVSGRGVGMDVVRSNIELIGGSIDVSSKLGVGTSFIIKIPLTLAIISALIVQVGDNRFAIPQTNVDELVRAQANSEHRIETIDQTRVLRLRNRLLPLIDLSGILRMKSDQELNDKNENEGFIIVANVGNRLFGIIVDAVYHTEEIVVKPLSGPLREIDFFSGNTLLGDGSVILIVDINGVAKHVGSSASIETDDLAKISDGTDLDVSTSSMLVFTAGSNEPKAVPLAIVTRLEDIEVDRIESSSSGDVVQYRGRLMPLVYVNESVKMLDKKAYHVLVFSDGDRSMGLIVDEIMDIVDDSFEVEIGSDEPGVLGSAIIDSKATDIIDVTHYVGIAFSNENVKSEWGHEAQARSILFVDDSVFFREMLPPVLRAAGYAVTVCDSAKDALTLMENGGKFDVIVSDLEMPSMDGLEFARVIKSNPNYNKIPMIALSSFTAPAALAKCKEVGYISHVAKFDRHGLISSLFESISGTGVAA